ncbi:MAG: hypothetical protein M1813_006516 [Trichoglossum hirsutum]|nr:MAG: hypothetical protein M1813_006516 [Trichoglossum hirsutum]
MLESRMRPNGTICIFCRRLDSYSSNVNRRTFNLQSSDSRGSLRPNGARNASRRKHTSREPNLLPISGDLGEQPRGGERQLGRQHTSEGIENLVDQRSPEVKRKLGVAPVDLIRLALLPRKVGARVRASAQATPEIKELLGLFGAAGDVFSQVLIGLARERDREFTFEDNAFRETDEKDGERLEIPVSEQSNIITRPLNRDEIIRRLQSTHTIDDILTVARAASKTASGRSEFMSLHFPLRMALKRCVLQRGPSHKELLVAFNSISSILLEHGPDLDFRYCVIGMRYAAWTGSLPAMKAMKRYLSACRDPHLRMPDDTWAGIVNRIVRFAGTAERPKLPVVWGGSEAWKTFEGLRSSTTWKRKEALNLLTGWETAGVAGPNETRDVSLESFLDRRNTPMLAKYVLSLGQLGASEAIWQEWLISRDRVLDVLRDTEAQDNGVVHVGVDAANTGENAELEPVDLHMAPSDAEQLLFHFLQALVAARDVWRSWQLVEEVQRHNPALLSSRIWTSLLGHCHPSYQPPGHIFRPNRGASILTEIVSNSLQTSSGTASIHELARTAIGYREEWNVSCELAGWREIWALWAECAVEVVRRGHAECVLDVERVLGVDWVTTPDGHGTHVRKSDDVETPNS